MEEEEEAIKVAGVILTHPRLLKLLQRFLDQESKSSFD